MTLSVSDVERLAKAGCKVDITREMMAYLQSDPLMPPPSNVGGRVYPLVEAFWDRWLPQHEGPKLR